MKYSLVLVTLLTSSLVASEFSSYDGEIRVGFQHQTDSEFAVGGKLHVETNPINCISFGSSFYITDNLGSFNINTKSYSILGEAYLKGMFQNTEIKLGRQEIDTPYADTDDIGMIPNSFEALTFSNSSFIDTALFAGYLKKMSGVDADVPEKFNDIGDVYTVGVTYENLDGLTLSSWYYDVSNKAKMVYVEAGYKKKFANLNIDFDFQYTNQLFIHGDDVDIYGASVEVEKGGLLLSLAYDTANSTDGQVAENFFGGGPFFINSEYTTMSESGANAQGVRYGLGYGIDNFVMSLSYLKADGDESDLEEVDVVVNYEISDDLTCDLIFSDVTDNIDKSQSFNNSRIFVNYTF